MSIVLEWEIDGQKHSYAVPPNARVTLGRDRACSVVLGDQTVSRLHAEIVTAGESRTIRNLSQTNTIVVDLPTRQVRLMSGQQVALESGSRVQLGRVGITIKPIEIRFRLRCTGPCGKVVDAPRSGFCPNCGTALATADTVVG